MKAFTAFLEGGVYISVMTDTVKFTYPLLYRFVYLWGPYIGTGVWMIILVVELLSGQDRAVWIILAIASLPFLPTLYILNRHLFCLIPTTIEIQDGRFSLSRFKKYQQFAIRDILRVEPNVSWPFQPILGGWTRVTFRTDLSNRQFYIAPYIQSHLLLLRLLTASEEQGTWNPETSGPLYFEIPAKALWYLRIGLVLLDMLALMLAVDAWLDFHVISVPSLIATLFLGLLVYGTWAYATSVVGQATFEGDHIVFKFVLGGRTRVRLRDITSVTDRLRRGGSILAPTGISVSLADGRRLWVPAYFRDFRQLVDKLTSPGQQR